MIRFNKTISKFAKRLALVVMLIGVSYPIWAGGLHYTGDNYGTIHYSQVSVNKNYPAAGNIYVYPADDTKPTTETLIANDNCQNHSISFFGSSFAFSVNDYHTYNLEVEDNGTYLWDGWYVDDATTPESTDKSTPHSTSVTATSTNSSSPTTKKYIAKWLLPIVSSVDLEEKDTTITEKVNQTQPIVFTLADDKSKENFSLSATPDPPFSNTTVTYEQGIYSTGLQYAPTGVHTAYQSSKMEEAETANVGTLTLISNYRGTNPVGSSKSFTWTIKEDYTPWFEMKDAECVFASVQPNTSSTATSSGTISPNTATWNYAAKQAYPSTHNGEDDLPDSEDDYLINGTIWKIKLTNNTNNVFAISGTPNEEGWYEVKQEQLTANDQSLITFTPPTNATTDDEYTATLNVTCEYYDANGNIIPALQKNETGWGSELVQTITLKGKALLAPSIMLNNKEAETITFENVVCGNPLKYTDGTEVATKNVTYITNISEEDLSRTIDGNGKDYFDIVVDRASAKIYVTLKPNVTPGTHSATLTITGTAEVEKTDENGDPIVGENGITETETVTKTATLTITANVILANPVLEGYAGNATAHLEWSEVPGATGYTLYYKEGTTITKGEGKSVDCDTEFSKDISLTNGKTYSFILVAKYNNMESLDAVSNVVTLLPTDFPETITWMNRVTSLYTGTPGYEGSIDGTNFPYMTKRKIDVTFAFNNPYDNGEGIEHNALFDYLVIFGETAFEGENHSATLTGPSNANTPCYIYEKQDDNITYRIRKMGEANFLNMNSSSKHPGFTIDATQDSDKTLSIYMTGFCPYASTGSTWGENGVMHITGSSETQVDIYLDNAQIFARPKKNNGTVEVGLGTTDDGTNSIMQNWLSATNGFMKGSGAVFAFTSTDYGFAPKIHIASNNTLKSHYGVTLKGNTTIKIDKKDNTFYGEYEQYSSPIHCLATALNTPVQLTLDDVWPSNMRMNGSLKLETSHTDAPLVDLGLSESSISFGGGEIILKNQDGVSIASHNIHIRTDKISTSTGTGEQSTTIYGASTAANQGSGTKATHSGGEIIDDISIRFSDGTYSSTTTLTVPTQTIVEGGSYNCTFATTMYNSFDTDTRKELTLITTDLPSNIATVNATNGVAVFTDGLNSFKDLMDYIYPEANWKDQESPVHYASLSTYYDGANKSYGYLSLTPDADNKVHLLLPKDMKNPIIKNWAISGPDFSATIGDATTDQTSAPIIYCTSQTEANTFGKTYNMLYMETDSYTQSAVASDAGYGMSYGEGENKLTATITSECAAAQINNNDEYVVSDRVYIMKPLVATDWMLFCPPFDVANVYIVEAYPEKQLIEDYKGDGKVSIVDTENIAAARKAQAQRFMDLYVYWYNYGEIQDGGDYFYDETNDALGEFIIDWAAYETGRGKDGAAVSGNAYQPVIEKLQHFMGYEESAYPEGMNWWNANYFLYESVGAWTPATSGDYTPTWVEVKVPSKDNNAIMTAGKIYAMNFPYNVIGGHNPNTTWDYWTGKYIIIESTKKDGGHAIRGGSFDMQGSKTTDDNKAWMCGNPTFKTLQITDADDNQVYSVLNNYGGTTITDTDTTIVVNSYTMKRNENGDISIPSTRGFVLANPPAPAANMRARSINYRTGEVIYESVENPDNNGGDITSGVPTIMGNLTLVVEPTAEGLTITPLKEQHVMLFDAEGKMIFSERISEEVSVSLPTGVYVVRGEYEQVKAIKK